MNELDLGFLRTAFGHMLRARRWSDAVVHLQRMGRMGPFTPLDGHEAAIVGAALALDHAHDWIVPQYREGLALACVDDGMLVRTLQWLRGHPDVEVADATSRIFTRQTAVAAHIPHAVGLGWGLRRRGEPAAVLCYFGDGATSQGDFYEAMNIAGVVRAPVVLLCINNGWAISTPTRRQTAVERLADKAAAAGIAGVRIDGADPIAVRDAVAAARSRALEGDGPTLVEAVTWRVCPHTTSDDPARYMPADEIAAWADHDPLARVRSRLAEHGVWSDDDQRAAEAAADRDLLAALAAAEAAPLESEAWFDHVHAVPPPRLAAERAALRRLLEESS